MQIFNRYAFNFVWSEKKSNILFKHKSAIKRNGVFAETCVSIWENQNKGEFVWCVVWVCRNLFYDGLLAI